MVVGAICTAVVVIVASGAYAIKVFITKAIDIDKIWFVDLEEEDDNDD